MLAVATDDFTVVIIDCDVKKVVRKFQGHSNKITDMVRLLFLFNKMSFLIIKVNKIKGV